MHDNHIEGGLPDSYGRLREMQVKKRSRGDMGRRDREERLRGDEKRDNEKRREEQRTCVNV